MRYVFDLDGTLCTGEYKKARPIDSAATLLKDLRQQGHSVIIYTARGMGSSAGNTGQAIARIAEMTLQQLKAWGFEYDELYFGKPAGDVYIDDKSLKSIAEFEESYGRCKSNQSRHNKI